MSLYFAPTKKQNNTFETHFLNKGHLDCSSPLELKEDRPPGLIMFRTHQLGQKATTCICYMVSELHFDKKAQESPGPLLQPSPHTHSLYLTDDALSRHISSEDKEAS